MSEQEAWGWVYFAAFAGMMLLFVAVFVALVVADIRRWWREWGQYRWR